jgi:hypothetical protein
MLHYVVQSVSPGVHFTIAMNSCRSPAMLGWSRFQFPFVTAPYVHPQPQHTADELTVTLGSCCSEDQFAWSLTWFEPLQTGISCFPYWLVRVLERHNGPIAHNRLIEEISVCQLLGIYRQCPSLYCDDSQLDTTFLQM